MRSDASRNAVAILAAAREVMGERRLAASMSEIAARAGVAVGTPYRHQPDHAGPSGCGASTTSLCFLPTYLSVLIAGLKA